MAPRFVIVLSDPDPVARGLVEIWGGLPTAWGHVDGTPLRRLTDEVWTLRREVRHIGDNGLDRLMPALVREANVPLVFPSIHRSESGPITFTVHPLGNLGDSAEVGGFPRTLTPTAPRLMSAALRALREPADRLSIPATFEATHHGPALDLPAFFIEIGGGADPEHPAPEHLRVLADLLPELVEAPSDRVALAVGGGHYAPHFTDLVQKRRWAFGHLLPRHALPTLTLETAAEAWRGTPAAEGILFARAADAELPLWEPIGIRLRDQDAPVRAGPGAG